MRTFRGPKATLRNNKLRRTLLASSVVAACAIIGLENAAAQSAIVVSSCDGITVTDQSSKLYMDRTGKLCVALPSNQTVNAQPATQNAVSGTANTTGNSTTLLVSAVTSNRIYVSAFSCANTGASASLISFQDGSGGTTLWTTIVPAGGGSNISGNTALFKTTSGNGVYFLPATASTTIYCSAAGYSGP